MDSKNFVIVIGGPGKFVGCDKAHDQTWTNYFVPIQLAAIRNLYNRQAGEKIHWLVYEPSYRHRWDDDSKITKAELAQSDGYWLHTIRKNTAAKVAANNARNYLHRIQQVAAKHKIQYVGINKPQDFWDYLKQLPDKSISRVWYSGHAAGKGLFLSLTHTDTCEPAANDTDIITVRSIVTNKDLARKFLIPSTASSKFYGCYTSNFAKTWKDTFKVRAEGAVSKIDFGVLDRPSGIANILERIEKTPTSLGSPGWTAY